MSLVKSLLNRAKKKLDILPKDLKELNLIIVKLNGVTTNNL